MIPKSACGTWRRQTSEMSENFARESEFPYPVFDLGIVDPHHSYCHTSPVLKRSLVRTNITSTFNIPSCHSPPGSASIGPLCDHEFHHCADILFFPAPVNAQYTSPVTTTTGTSFKLVTARSLTGAIPTSSAGSALALFSSPVQQLDTH